MNNRLTVNHVGLSQCESKVKQSTYNCWYFLTTALSWSHAPKHTFSTRQYLCAIPANSWHDKTWPSSTRLHREADWNEDRRTGGGVTKPWIITGVTNWNWIWCRFSARFFNEFYPKNLLFDITRVSELRIIYQFRHNGTERQQRGAEISGAQMVANCPGAE